MWLLFAGAAVAEQRYLADVVDLPLMPGLWEVPDAGMVFDKPQGRIVEAEARGDETPDAVRAYYADALPPLGWRAEGRAQPDAATNSEGKRAVARLPWADTFRRDGEVLRIEISERAGAVAVRFSITPD
ncbi:MAG: hypothetical protein RIM84_25085 [Alphaproteobacteria bacterium]